MTEPTTPRQQEQLDDKDLEENTYHAAPFVTPPSTATSSTETVSTNDEDARHCEEWELFSNFDGTSRPSSESRSDGQRSSRSTEPWEAAEHESSRGEESSNHELDDDDAAVSSASDSEANESEEESHNGDEDESDEPTPPMDQNESDQGDDTIAADGTSEGEAAILESSGLMRECSLRDLTSPQVIPESARSDGSSRAVSPEGLESIAPTAVSSSRIQVFVRVRPLNRGEGGAAAVTLGESANSLRVQSIHLSSVTECSVDRVFSDGSTQEDVYQGVERGIHAALEGLNATIFAYGQTGTGKTHTMFGDEQADGLGGGDLCSNVTASISTIPVSWGVIPRAMCELITKAHAMADHQDAKAQLSCSFLQIYNDRVFDLLTDRRRQKPLIIREQPMVDGGTNVVIQGLSSEPIASVADALQLVRRGRVNRSVRETELNASSSRSHAIVQVHVTIETKLPNGDKRIRSSRLNLVDLAGSEKWNTDLEMEDRHTVELKNINTSLSALGNCIAALAETGRRHIPYRDSTLTRLLQDSFGGNTLAFLIATVSSSQRATEETIRTLQFADRARSVMQVVKVNESFSGSSELLAAKAQIKSLRERLASEQRRRHETRLKEYEAMQHDFATKLQAKDEEIQRLARDNEVFAKWRSDDVARIRALESKIKEAEDGAKLGTAMEQPEQTWQHEDRMAISREDLAPFHKDRRREDNQSATDTRATVRPSNDRDSGDKHPRLVRKSSIKNTVNTPKQRESSPAPAPAHDRNGKPRVKSYRSLLEKYALPSHKGQRTEPQRDARRQNHCESNSHTNSKHFGSLAAVAKPKETFADEALPLEESAAAVAFSPQKREQFALPTSDSGYASHPPTTRSMSFVQATHNLLPPQSHSPTMLYKADSLPVLTRQQQPSTLQQPQLRGTPAQPVQGRGEGGYTSFHYNTTSDLPAKQAWQLPPVLSDTPSMTRTEPSVAVTAQPETCAKHSLKGCVLCAVKDSSWSPGPAIYHTSSVSTIKSSSIPPSNEVTTGGGDGLPCERHQLPGCFICTKTISATNWRSAASLPTGPTSTSPYPYSTGSSSSTTSASIHLATSNYPGTGQSFAPKQDSKCAIHKLANCVICAGPTRLEPSSPTKTTHAPVPDPPWRSPAFPSIDASPASSSAATTSYSSAYMASVTASAMRGIQPPSFSYSPSSSNSALFRTDDGPVHNNASSSMVPSSSSAIRSSIKQLAHDTTTNTTTHKQFNSLVRDASDAANIVLRRRA